MVNYDIRQERRLELLKNSGLSDEEIANRLGWDLDHTKKVLKFLVLDKIQCAPVTIIKGRRIKKKV